MDLIAAYICLMIIRRTTQYTSLLKKKEVFMFRGLIDTKSNINDEKPDDDTLYLNREEEQPL